MCVYKNKNNQNKNNLTASRSIGMPNTRRSEKGEAQTVLFAINQGWSYELVPCTDEAILAVDDELSRL